MRQCRLNFAEHRYDCEAGIVGEHNATELIITPPAIMPDEAVYRLCFEPGGVSEIISKRSDGTLAYPLPAAVTATAFCCVTLIGYIGNEQVYKSRMVQLHFCRAADGDADIDPQQPGIVAEVNQNTAARHSHDNKPVIDLLTADDTGTLLYDGKAISGGGSTGTELFIVNVQVQSGAEYTITSHDKTYTQIDEAYKAGKQILAVCTITGDNTVYLIPLVLATETDYEFSMFVGAVFSVYVDNTDTWDIYIGELEASTIKAKISADASAESSSLQTILNYMVYPAVEKAHEHSNKSVLDGLSDSNGVLYYNNKPIIAQKISEGPYITLADNTEYRLTDVSTLTLSYPTGDFECWMRLTFAASGNITVTLPADTKYIGTAPDFKNGETWELSFKDKVLAAQKVGEGT
nr:MAG TPA: hypothetical protein [Caudoviricetes sp.]